MGNKLNKEKKPKDLNELLQSTRFSEEEIKNWYRNFLKDFPKGQVTKRQFQILYSQQFPAGDAQTFAEHVFRTFDTDGDKRLDFREFMTALNMTSRAGPQERLKWAFQMYDIDNSGEISMDECQVLIEAIFRLHKPAGDRQSLSAKDMTASLFKAIDKNRDGTLSLSEFVAGAKKNPTLVTLLSGDHKCMKALAVS